MPAHGERMGEARVRLLAAYVPQHGRAACRKGRTLSPDPESPAAPPPELGARGRAIVIVMWCSFLAASVATMISFAFVDPAPIVAVLPWAGPGASRTTVYSLGFFYFWAICAAAALSRRSCWRHPPLNRRRPTANAMLTRAGAGRDRPHRRAAGGSPERDAARRQRARVRLLLRGASQGLSARGRGTLHPLRNLAVWVLLGIFYGAPWLQWNGRQAVLFDLPARKFYIFGLTLWPQDFIFLTWLLIIAALRLFFFTAVGGRLWCGYACPQTVWTEAFLWMEKLTEGDRSRRMKLDKAPWSAKSSRARRPSSSCGSASRSGPASPSSASSRRSASWPPRSRRLSSSARGKAFWVLFYGFATYGNAGFLREQVCKYMCPYARFQSAMFDQRHADRHLRRRARRAARRAASGASTRSAAGLGDCIDCTLCVQVCPTGIDIRKGLQYECIACAACIDACDAVMDRMGYPRGLIRYTTQHALDHQQTHVLRPRMIVYGTLLALLCVGFVVALAHAQARGARRDARPQRALSQCSRLARSRTSTR